MEQLKTSVYQKSSVSSAWTECEINEANAGDLIAISGMDDIFVGETISTSTDAIEPMPVLHIDEPTLTNEFLDE